MKPQTSITQSLKVIVLAGILAFGLQYVSAQTTWSPPTGSPPNNNTSAPVNVGGTGQIKSGGLTLGSGLGFSDPNSIGLNVAGGGVVFKLTSSGPSAGQVLKAADSTGKLVWGTDATGGGGGGTTYSAGNGLLLSGSTFSINSPACVGGQKSRWTGTAWVCEADATGGGGTPPTGPVTGSVLGGGTTGRFGVNPVACTGVSGVVWGQATHDASTGAVNCPSGSVAQTTGYYTCGTGGSCSFAGGCTVQTKICVKN